MIKKLPVLIAASAILSGCSFLSYSRALYVPPHPGIAGPQTDRPLPEVAYFAYDKTPIAPKLRELFHAESDYYVVYSLTFRSVGVNGQKGNRVTGSYYKSKTPGKKKLVIIPPIYGSSAFPAETTLRHLTEWNESKDTNAIIIDGDRDICDYALFMKIRTDAELTTEFNGCALRIKNTIIDTRRLIDWAEVRPEIDGERIGIIGFSTGAMVASLAASVDQRIAAGTFVMSGGDLHDTFAQSEEETTRLARESIMRNLGIDAKTLAQKIKPPLDPVNPARYAGRIDPRRTLMFESKHDDYIPESARRNLWEAMGRPEIITFPYRHKASFLMSMTVLGMDFLQKEVARFFREKL